MTAERAAAFVMPYGKHRGRSLLAIDAAGHRGYLRWIEDTFHDGSIRRAVVHYLETHSPCPASPD
jgi:hypothetical protein